VNSYVMLLDLGITLTQAFLGSLKGNKVAGNIDNLLGVGQSFVDALMAHKDDVITKAALEAQRG
jgi:hypothetical protein